MLDRLRQLGVKIAIDDFGTQYSSLDYLKSYRVSRVKIPRSLIDASTQDPDASAMVRAIIGLGRELGIDVVAQGVETEAQRELLSCPPSPAKVQGFYYSAPVPAAEATKLLRQGLVSRASTDLALLDKKAAARNDARPEVWCVSDRKTTSFELDPGFRTIG